MQRSTSSQGPSAVLDRVTDSQRESSKWDTMRRRRVDEILLPYVEGVPVDPCVEMGEKLINAIQVMVSNNLKCLAVKRNQKLVGMIRLEDAFQKVGLTLPSV